MVYIDKNKDIITIPRHTKADYNTYSLVLSSSMSTTFTLVDEMGNISTNPFFYSFPLDNKEIAEGEYSYKLISEDVILETGLITYGSYSRSGLVMNNTSNLKLQYNGKDKYKMLQPED